MAERLQKIIAAAGLASRRTSELLIREGRVAVDGVTVTELGTQADPSTQKITIDGRLVPSAPKRHLYVALHKPRGYACTLADAHAKQLIGSLIDLPGKPMLRPVGRLDVESEGLIFLSDDGDFIYKMTHPRYHVTKTYLATVRGTPTEEELERLRTGVYLDDGRTAPADGVRMAGVFAPTDTSDVELILHEGRNRQVRRMMQAIGHPVLRLVRTQVGPITIKGMPSGTWRHLTPAEVKRLFEMPAVAKAKSSATADDKPVQRRKPSPSPSTGETRNTHVPRRGAARIVDPRAYDRENDLGAPWKRPGYVDQRALRLEAKNKPTSPKPRRKSDG